VAEHKAQQAQRPPRAIQARCVSSAGAPRRLERIERSRQRALQAQAPEEGCKLMMEVQHMEEEEEEEQRQQEEQKRRRVIVLRRLALNLRRRWRWLRRLYINSQADFEELQSTRGVQW
jgi:hypothetical protein